MKLGVLSPVFADYSFEEMLKYLSDRDVHEVELGAGGWPGDKHLNVQRLLTDLSWAQEIKDLLAKYDMTISALACHSNPLHPNKEFAQSHDRQFKDALRACGILGVKTIVGFAGCPGDSEGSKYPNWVVCPWPEDFLDILNWQWNEKVIPYWRDTAEFARQQGVEHIAFELHPGFVVYNPETCLKLREAVGDIIGANVDPSHLFWQGMDPVAAIHALKGAIYHFHAKDSRVDPYNSAVNGVLDTKPFGTIINRSWLHRTVGFGHSQQVWRDIMSALKIVGYDGAVSIEHEEMLMTPMEGLEKSIAFMKDVIITQPTGQPWWL